MVIKFFLTLSITKSFQAVLLNLWKTNQATLFFIKIFPNNEFRESNKVKQLSHYNYNNKINNKNSGIIENNFEINIDTNKKLNINNNNSNENHIINKYNDKNSITTDINYNDDVTIINNNSDKTTKK